MEKSTLTPLGVKQSSQRPEPQERQAKQLDQLWTRRKNTVASNKSYSSLYSESAQGIPV